MNAVFEAMPEGVCALPEDTLLEFRGTDAATFLQGQTTADFAGIEPGDIRNGAFCDIKGRVLADFTATMAADDLIIMRTHGSIAEPLMTHLKKYLMFSKTELGKSGLSVFGVLGPETHQQLGLTAAAEDATRAVVFGEGFALARRGQRTELYLPEDTQFDSVETATPAGWQRGTVLAGEARIHAATMGKYLPQDLNYDLEGWVNFQKGCYTGQEIIARLHFRGTPKRRLYRATQAGDAAPAAGSVLTTGEDKSLGSVVNAVADAGDTYLLVETTEDGFAHALRSEGGTEPLREIPRASD